MYIIRIYIAATFTRSCIHQVHLYDSIDRTIVDFLFHLIGNGINDFLCILNLQGITRSDANQILCRTVVALLEFCFVFLFI